MLLQTAELLLAVALVSQGLRVGTDLCCRGIDACNLHSFGFLCDCLDVVLPVIRSLVARRVRASNVLIVRFLCFSRFASWLYGESPSAGAKRCPSALRGCLSNFTLVAPLLEDQ